MAVLNEEQTMLRDMAREWADNESPVTAFRKMRDAAPAEGYRRRRLERDGRDGLGRDRHPRGVWRHRTSAICRSGWCSSSSAAR